MDLKFVYGVKKVVTYINQHFREDVGVEDCARLLGYSPRYCNRMFRDYYGETIGARLRYLRMQAAKNDLLRCRSVKEVARSLSFDSVDGFSRAFRKEFGITPSEYLQGGTLKEPYVADYDYTISYADWMKGENPSHDGVWEYEYYDPMTENYSKMLWGEGRFEAPYEKESISDPNWYCRNRSWGYGMHPGKGVQAVRTFRCPYDGIVDVFFSAARISKVRPPRTPCSLQLRHNGQLIFPEENAVVLQDVTAAFLTVTRTVRKGDRISLHVDAMGNISSDGILLYRQRVRYQSITERNDIQEK